MLQVLDFEAVASCGSLRGRLGVVVVAVQRNNTDFTVAVQIKKHRIHSCLQLAGTNRCRGQRHQHLALACTCRRFHHKANKVTMHTVLLTHHNHYHDMKPARGHHSPLAQHNRTWSPPQRLSRHTAASNYHHHHRHPALVRPCLYSPSQTNSRLGTSCRRGATSNTAALVPAPVLPLAVPGAVPVLG